jgi:hypothetical protein
VTFFGLIFTPVFYDVIRRFTKKKGAVAVETAHAGDTEHVVEMPRGGAH